MWPAQMLPGHFLSRDLDIFLFIHFSELGSTSGSPQSDSDPTPLPVVLNRSHSDASINSVKHVEPSAPGSGLADSAEGVLSLADHERQGYDSDSGLSFLPIANPGPAKVRF